MKLAVLGCGKMATAMVRRWLATDLLQSQQIAAATRTETSAARVRQDLAIACDTDIDALVSRAEVVLLAIKPQQLETVLGALEVAPPAGQLWLSVLAGTTLGQLRQWLGSDPQIVRLMPNTPAAIGQGVTAICSSRDLDADTRATLTSWLEALGTVVELEEERIDAFTAIAGSGPAYAFLFIESLARAAEELGFDAADAQAMALGVARGAAELATDAGRPASTLRAEVTSPGGCTEAAIAVLETGRWSDLLHAAVQAAVRRADELSRTTEQGERPESS